LELDLFNLYCFARYHYIIRVMKLWNVFGGGKKCFKNFSQKLWRVKLFGRHKAPGQALRLFLGTVDCFLRAAEAES